MKRFTLTRFRHANAALVLGLLLTVGGLADAATPPDAAAPPAPSFTLPARDGSVSLDALRGRVVYVDFWASWCGPCQLSFPWMRELHDRYAKQGLVIVAIDLDKDRKAADAFLSRHTSPFLVAYDPAGKSAEAFEVGAMPSSYLIGPQGTVLHTMSGFDEDKARQTEALIQKALVP